MTPNQYPMKTRAEVAQRIAKHLLTDGLSAVPLNATLTFASTLLTLNGYRNDWRWLREHRAKAHREDGRALRALAQRLVLRLNIEGEDISETTARVVDSLTVDTAHHLARSGDRAAIVARLVEQDRHQLAVLLTDALVRLAGYDAVIDELHQLRAQLAIAQAHAEQAAVVTA